MLVDETKALLSKLDIQQTEPTNQQITSAPFKILAGIGSLFSVIAVLPVPYLVFRSIYYLITNETKFSFDEMMRSDNPVFWTFAPLIALLATIAIAPFNLYNTHKTIQAAQFKEGGFSYSALAKIAFGFLFLTSGSVNGYNMNYAFNDIFGEERHVSRLITQISFVTIATVFAGIGDARVVLHYAQQDVPKDVRYVGRVFKKVVGKFGLFADNHRVRSEQTRKQLIQAIRYKLDDVSNVCLMALTETEIKQHEELLKEQSWIQDMHSAEFQHFLTLMQKEFPYARYVFSDVLGTIAAATLAYFGNQNVFAYAKLAIVGFLEFCGTSSKNNAVETAGEVFSSIGYGVGFLVGLFLIRDLFIRDIAKATTFDEFKQRLPKILLPLIPALSFGLLNIIMTVLNAELSSSNKVIVSCAAIIGATVVSRYGIEGGTEELMGRHNLRRDLAAIIPNIMQYVMTLGAEELKQLHDKLMQVDLSETPELAGSNYAIQGYGLRQ